MVTAPGSPSILANGILINEQQVDWVGDLLAYLRTNGLTRIEPSEEAQTDWVRQVQDIVRGTLFPTANSWFMGANIPGKPRVFSAYIGGLDSYRRICEKVAAEGYPGFKMTTPQASRKIGSS